MTSGAPETPPRRVLLVNLGEDWIRGTEQVALDLVRSLDRTRFVPVVWSNAPSLARRCREIGVEAHHSPFGTFFLPGAGRFSLRRYLSYIRTGLDLVRRHRIDVIHANGSAPLQFCVPLGLVARCPVIGHLHAEDDRRARFAFLAHLAHLVVGVSRRTVAGLLADGMDRRRIRVVHNGVDPARFAPSDPPGQGLRAELGLGAEVPLIGTVGSLIHRKGHDVLLRAMARLRATNPDAHLVIAGDGAERARYEAMCAELGVAGHVHLLGYREDPSAVYRAADVFVLAARSEALPLVLIEAAQFGLPCVATDVGGTSEVVLHERTGLLVPAEDDAALAAALGRLLDEPALRRSFGDAARAHAAGHFGLAAMVAAFEALYEEVLDRRRARDLGGVLSRVAPYLRRVRHRPSSRGDEGA